MASCLWSSSILRSIGVVAIPDSFASSLAPVLSGTHLPTSEGWKVELAWQREEVGRSVGMTSTGNRTRVTRMVAECFTNYATATRVIPTQATEANFYAPIFTHKNKLLVLLDHITSLCSSSRVLLH